MLGLDKIEIDCYNLNVAEMKPFLPDRHVRPSPQESNVRPAQIHVKLKYMLLKIIYHKYKLINYI